MASAPVWSKTLARKTPVNSKGQDRSEQARSAGVLSQIEDATDAILRKHQNKSA